MGGLFSGFDCLALESSKLPTKSNPTKIMLEYLVMVDLLNIVSRFSDDYLFYFTMSKIFPGRRNLSFANLREIYKLKNKQPTTRNFSHAQKPSQKTQTPKQAAVSPLQSV
jgi:hypothetical protein